MKLVRCVCVCVRAGCRYDRLKWLPVPSVVSGDGGGSSTDGGCGDDSLGDGGGVCTRYYFNACVCVFVCVCIL